VVYQLGQLVKMQTREDNQKNIHRYYKDEREKYQQAIIEDWGLNNHSRS
jgi:F420-0:gamma-glutamyl ligase-like protein